MGQQQYFGLGELLERGDLAAGGDEPVEVVAEAGEHDQGDHRERGGGVVLVRFLQPAAQAEAKKEQQSARPDDAEQGTLGPLPGEGQHLESVAVGLGPQPLVLRAF